MGDQSGLPLSDSFEQSEVGIVVVLRVGIVAIDDIVGKNFQVIVILAGGEPLEGADANVRLRDAGENSAGHEAFAEHVITTCDRGQRPGRRHTEGSHRFGDDIFAQDRT